MDSAVEFILTIPSEDGNKAYEVFSKDLIHFFSIVFKQYLKKNNKIDPCQCIENINKTRHLLGTNQSYQLIADKLLNYANDAKKYNLTLVITLHLVGL
jgi:CRISPR/Cas system-associated protein Cas7 (RAMP superfamily)